MNLFYEADDIDDISKIETNKEFAKRFEHNKKREELQRFEELKKKGIAGDSEDEDSSESEEEDGDQAVASDLKLFDALVKIRNKDPIINEKDKKLFESESEEEEEEDEGKRKSKKEKKKPVYLKDVVGQDLNGEGSDGEEEEGSKDGVKSYYEEQDEYRKALLDATEGVFEDEDGDLLIEKKTSGEDEEEDAEVEEKKKKLDEYFGEDDKLEENDMFLKKFFLDKLWIDKEKEKKPVDLHVLSEDEEEVDKQEKYEASYNFRFEEDAGDRVMGHARFTEGSVRKKSNTRKLQRKSKEERMAQAEFERKEELKHMKNLKKKEIEEKLQKIRDIAGIGEDGVCALNEDDLEEEFDPEEYDRKMKETFDVDYYDKGDVDPGFGSGGDDDLEKPDFDKEDELLGLPKDWDVGGSGDGFLAAREKILKRKTENKDIDTEVDNEEVDDELPIEGKRKRKRKIPLREKIALDNELEEYYKLDYEDTIGDLKTRFKYTTVPSQRYGLNGEEMLMMDEKELNQYVPLKKLAPYREKEWKVPNAKRHSLKLKSKSLRKGADLKDQKSLNKHTRKRDGHSTTETGSADHGEMQLDESNGDVVTMSRRSKRRHRQAEIKLSHARLVAYGKIPSTSKNNKKH